MKINIILNMTRIIIYNNITRILQLGLHRDQFIINLIIILLIILNIINYQIQLRKISSNARDLKRFYALYRNY